MTCNHCTGRVKKNLSALEGVTAVEVALTTGTATVESNDAVSDAVLTATIEDSGYDVRAIVIA